MGSRAEQQPTERSEDESVAFLHLRGRGEEVAALSMNKPSQQFCKPPIFTTLQLLSSFLKQFRRSAFRRFSLFPYLSEIIF
ncbi:hypothetical protein ACH5RR_014551 [Cinchona calisaya]|uniref:Uncharacterized protein n=1 Tax=Cinchona calisaya TaxID=153742 RepID=A0ABD3A3A7_9GENT